MKLSIEIEPKDPITMHRRYEKLFKESKGGLLPINITGEFRFGPEFRISREHQTLKTEFSLNLIPGRHYVEISK